MEGKTFSNTATYQKLKGRFHQHYHPPPLCKSGGMTLRVRQRVKVKRRRKNKISPSDFSKPILKKLQPQSVASGGFFFAPFMNKSSSTLMFICIAVFQVANFSVKITHNRGQFIPTKLSRVVASTKLALLTLGRTRKFIAPPWYKGWEEGCMEPLPRVFDMLQYFETILPLMEAFDLLNKMRSWIIERLDRKLMSRGLISYRRLVGSCSRMALDSSIIVEICDETMAKMWRKPVEM